MLRMKHLVLVAALLLCAANIMAVNFRAGDAVYIPLAGHIGGGASALFISDVFIQNPNNEPIDVSYAYIQFGTTNRTDVPAFRLEANERREVRDFMTASRASGGLGLTGSPFGAVIVFGCRAGGNCSDYDQTSGSDPDFRNVIVSSRIFSVPGSATADPFNAPSTGQFFPAFPWYSIASMNTGSGGVGTPAQLNRVVVTGLRATGGAGVGTYRTNLGVMNASSFSNTVILAKLFRGNAPATPLGEFRFTLGPLQVNQTNIVNLFNLTPGPDMTILFVTLEQESSTATPDADPGCAANGGCPGFFGWASVLDNGSQDATTMEGTYEIPLTIDALEAIYGSKAGGGAIVRRAVRR